jgi:acetyl esterase/lipase
MSGIDLVREFLAQARPRDANGVPIVADVATRRAEMDAFGAAAALPEGWSVVENLSLGRDTERLSGPDVKAGRCILYLHGGGYMLGSPRSHRSLAARLGAALNAEVFVLDYRLAPEHPFPAAVDDAHAAFIALEAKGFAANRIVVMGDSAGGGLSLALALRRKAEGLAQPAALGLMSPWVEMAEERPSYRTRAEADPMLTVQGMKEFRDAYLAGHDPFDVYASPVRGDMAGLAPMLIHVGTDELLLSECEALARKAIDAGVDATLEIWPRMIHVWHAFGAYLPEAEEAVERLGQWAQRRIAP